MGEIYTIPDTAHARLSASGYYRWHKDACPGSIRLCEGIPSKTSKAAAEGTVAHELAEKALKLRMPLFLYEGQTFHASGYDIKITHEMIHAVELYVEAVREDTLRSDSLFVEVSLTSSLQNIHPSLGGMSDVVLVKPTERKLKVYDYKHGKGIYVDVEGNKQLQYYALGAFLKYGGRAPVDEVEVVVVQPRYGGTEPIRSWSFDVLDLLAFEQTLVESANLTEDPDAPIRAGPWCRFCPAKAEAKCAVYMEAAAEEKTVDVDLFEDLT